MLFKKRSDQTDERYNYEKFINGCVPGGIAGVRRLGLYPKNDSLQIDSSLRSE